MERLQRVRDQVEELRELGLSGTAFRAAWELRLRTGLARRSPALPPDPESSTRWRERLPWASPGPLVLAMAPRVSIEAVEALRGHARNAARGVIRCFGRWDGDYGQPLDWHRNPTNGQRWNPSAHWSDALRDGDRVGDVKLTWEAARFPQAFHLARAAALSPVERDAFWVAFSSQVRGFIEDNPYPLGVHWFSNQEATIRLNAWHFALSTFSGLGIDTAALCEEVSRYAAAVGHHTEHEIAYAERAVYNNHLIAEALGLFLVAWMRPDRPESRRWRRRGLALLDEQATRQVYPDGGYINLSHNYHRVIAQDYLLAWRLLRADGYSDMPSSWRRALTSSLDFLVAHQNPSDGRLPNQGANDGSLPRVLSTCDFSDFRPTLQALSLCLRGERLYPAGPWDEESAWLLGPDALQAPLREPSRRSVAFRHTGYSVLRSGDDQGTFAALRCGTVLDRFGQIDMLHLDAWWRGENVLVDGGTYLYNEQPQWHDHFMRTESHNTVTVDARDQMLHFRRFKFLYPTKARLERFEVAPGYTHAVGEHSGYGRHEGGCIHHRSARLFDDGTMVVIDRITGEGEHSARLHWLGGPYPHTGDPAHGAMTLHTPKGDYGVAVFDRTGAPFAGTVVRGQTEPPRGWVSRYYGEREDVPSLAVEQRAKCPLEFVTVLGEGPLEVSVEGGRWTVRAAGATHTFDWQEAIEAV
nr:alginate lyase family protein [Deltaproteobacteria bacterium]